eukprot:8841746-Pyramimonas_sp.AAC.1
MSRIAVLYLGAAASHWHDDLTPVGIVSYDREWATPASPVVLRGCGAMLQCKPCVSSVHENDPTFPSAVRDQRIGKSGSIAGCRPNRALHGDTP